MENTVSQELLIIYGMRLALDIGSSSIGWWLYETENNEITGILDAGVRLFQDGREPARGAIPGASLALNRRQKRSMRKMRKRYLRRRTSLMKKLVAAGLMPADPAAAKEVEKLDPFELRARALDKRLELVEIGRSLFHINQRRGFQSNRKTVRSDNERDLIKDATGRLDQAMMVKGAKTYGQFLHMMRSEVEDRRKKPSVRTRLTVARRGDDEKEKNGYDYYPDRRHFKEEFNKIWDAQAKHHSDILTDDVRSAIFETIFHQRPLKEQEVGLCFFAGFHGVSAGQRRLPKAHPLFQRRVLFETVNNLKVIADGKPRRFLTMEERDTIIHALDNKKPTKSLSSMSLKLKALGKLLKLKDGERFSLDTAYRDSIACDTVRSLMIHPDQFGPAWSSLNWQQQWRVIRRARKIQTARCAQVVVDWLMRNFGLKVQNAWNILDAPLPDGYGRLGLSATRAILENLQGDVVNYSDAVAACGWHHSDKRTGEAPDALPYYGEAMPNDVIPGTGRRTDGEVECFGRITNPSVHIGLNQIRRLVNQIITVYGKKPDEIVLELARDLKNNDKKKLEIRRRIGENTKAAQKRSEKLNELGVQDNGYNRMLLRLWEELGPAVGPRCCPYTGKPISVAMIFDGSCDVDHILPYSLTLDDSAANKTLCLREANREKTNRTPYEAWGGDQDRWFIISRNLKNLPPNKQWRFSPDAMQKHEDKGGFFDRALKDTQYLSRIARSYLDTLYTEGGHVWVVPGQMTEMLRRHWGLNSLLFDANRDVVKAKNRFDHRHHAIDAAVVGATDRSLLNRISRTAGRDEVEGKSAEDIARSIDPPWEGFTRDVADQVARIIVSYRPDHGSVSRKDGFDQTIGQMHNDYAYGLVKENGEIVENRVVKRKPLSDLKAANLVEGGKQVVRDKVLRQLLQEATSKAQGEEEFEAALMAFASTEYMPDGRDNPYFRVRSVRLIEAMSAKSRVDLKNKDGKVYKTHKADSNHCYELWRMPDGKIKAQGITTFEAHSGDVKRPHPAAKKIMSAQKRDMVAIEQDGQTVICYVQKLSEDRGLTLVPHFEGNVADRVKNKQFKFIEMAASSLVKAGARRVSVDVMGRVKDPGPAW